MSAIVLCSASPRRRELLAQAGVPFLLHAVDLDESVEPGEQPIPYVRRLAEAKARAARDEVKDLDYTYLGADTTVVAGDTILGKPLDALEAATMLARLSGGWHEVTTGFCVLRGAHAIVEHTTTRVELRVVAPDEIEAYVASGEWEGKAGGYAIQGLAGALVRQIVGSYANVVGLPVCEVLETLQQLGALPAGWRLGGRVSELAERLAAVEAAVSAACAAARRPRDRVEVVAVSKTVPAARIAEAVRAGQTLFGENYAQDLRDKVPAVADAHWHFIGPLQKNKVKYVVGTAELIHSVDSFELAEAIDARARMLGRKQRVLLQVNTGDEPQKAGVHPAELAALLAQLRQLPSLIVEGLMCIPPVDEAPRPHFATLRALAGAHQLPRLSMGMSSDFADAIAEGATLVRIGTAIFGARA